jgi:hypothetical protein
MAALDYARLHFHPLDYSHLYIDIQSGAALEL